MPTKMHVVTVDKHGNRLGPGEWVDVPAPQSEPAGLAAIPSYIARLFASTAPYASCSVFTAGGGAGFGICRRGSEVQFLFTIEWREHSAQEHCIREFFAANDLAPIHDYLAQNGLVPDSTRVLIYQTPD